MEEKRVGRLLQASSKDSSLPLDANKLRALIRRTGSEGKGMLQPSVFTCWGWGLLCPKSPALHAKEKMIKLKREIEKQIGSLPYEFTPFKMMCKRCGSQEIDAGRLKKILEKHEKLIREKIAIEQQIAKLREDLVF